MMLAICAAVLSLSTPLQTTEATRRVRITADADALEDGRRYWHHTRT